MFSFPGFFPYNLGALRKSYNQRYSRTFTMDFYDDYPRNWPFSCKCNNSLRWLKFPCLRIPTIFSASASHTRPRIPTSSSCETQSISPRSKFGFGSVEVTETNVMVPLPSKQASRLYRPSVFESLPREIRDLIYGYLGLPVGSTRWEDCFCKHCDALYKKEYPEIYKRIIPTHSNLTWWYDQLKADGLPVVEHKRRNECLHVTNEGYFLGIGVSAHKALWSELGPLTQ